jgi:hypothetical protein
MSRQGCLGTSESLDEERHWATLTLPTNDNSCPWWSDIISSSWHLTLSKVGQRVFPWSRKENGIIEPVENGGQ